MIFTSYTYLLFLVFAFIVYWIIPSSYRKLLLVILSYIFYCYWRWEYGILLFGISLFNFFYVKKIIAEKSFSGLLILGIVVNLLPLLYFKYTFFALDNISTVIKWFGYDWKPIIFNIILPLGISFSTFQNIAYLVDVSAGEKPFVKLQDFLLFKAFWPQLLSGPIIRQSEIKEQIETPRYLDYQDFSYGLKRILFGLFKKTLFANTLAPYVDMVFVSNITPGVVDSVAGTLAFGLQIYFDFSAYSDIAIGSARLFGYRFPENFNKPYSSSSPQEFWNRWHMTLSRWIKDYLFTPLAFSFRKKPGLNNVWLIVSMAVCGLWHGAQWTFVLWGVWHGIILVLNQTLLKKFFSPAENNNRLIFKLRKMAGIFVTFTLVTLGWILFKARDMGQAGNMLSSMITLKNGLRPIILRESAILIIALIFMGLMLWDYISGLNEIHKKIREIPVFSIISKIVMPFIYVIMILGIIIFDQQAKTFVYFQF